MWTPRAPAPCRPAATSRRPLARRRRHPNPAPGARSPAGRTASPSPTFRLRSLPLPRRPRLRRAWRRRLRLLPHPATRPPQTEALLRSPPWPPCWPPIPDRGGSCASAWPQHRPRSRTLLPASPRAKQAADPVTRVGEAEAVAWNAKSEPEPSRLTHVFFVAISNHITHPPGLGGCPSAQALSHPTISGQPWSDHVVRPISPSPARPETTPLPDRRRPSICADPGEPQR
jgi:hypothetical protein